MTPASNPIKPNPNAPSLTVRAKRRAFRRRIRRPILRITACLITAHALATTTAILLSIHQLNAGAPTRGLVEWRDGYLIERGTIRTSLGIDRYNLILRPTPFDSSLPFIVDHNPARQRFLEDAPRWVRTELPGRARPHIPDTIHAAGVNNFAIGWPLRMYRATHANWTDEAHRDSYLNTPSTIYAVQTHADTPFACPIIHGTVGLVPTGTYLGQTYWGSIDTFQFTRHLPTFITTHLKLPPQIPITPIWLGTLINTALFAALIVLTYKAATTLRRHIHKKRHPAAIPCPNCRYDLKGLTTAQCPECGEQVPE